MPPRFTDFVDRLTGQSFETLLRLLFLRMGYKTQLTQATGDYGADLILDDGSAHLYAAQAKRYKGDVGICAIQEVLGGMSYYGCQTGVICTTANLTRQATQLAVKHGAVIILSRAILLNLFDQYLSDVVVLPLAQMSEEP
jgi:restriction system protein